MEKKVKTTFVIAIFLVAVMLAGSIGNVTAGKPAPKECNDGLDNDGDGAIDLADAGCDNKRDNDETNCGDGVCEGGEDSGSCPADCGPADSCSDTDGGHNIWFLGTTSGFLNQVPYSNDDYCVDAGTVNEYNCTLNYEYSQQQSCGTDFLNVTYCWGNSTYQDYINYSCDSGKCEESATHIWLEDCQYGCSAGACNPPPASCSDTDGGYDPFVQGTVSGYLGGGYPYDWTDFCNSTAIVVEYYCLGDNPYSGIIDCSVNGTIQCVNGACV